MHWLLTLRQGRSHWLCLPGGISLEHQTNTLDNTQKTGTGDGTVPGVSPATSYGQTATGEKPGNDCVPGILPPPDGLDGTVKRGKQPTPNTKVTTDNRGTRLDGPHSTRTTLAHWRVSETFDTVPDATTDDTHRKGTAKVVEDNNGTWISTVISGHCVLFFVIREESACACTCTCTCAWQASVSEWFAVGEGGMPF